MRDPHRTVCGRCLDDFNDIWALKQHQDDCLRHELPDVRLPSEDIEVGTTIAALCHASTPNRTRSPSLAGG
jgi:hypothetical protein